MSTLNQRKDVKTPWSLAILFENCPGYEGALAVLEVELIADGCGAIYPNPEHNAFVKFDQTFKQAYEQAWEWAKKDATTKPEEREKLLKVDARFRLERVPVPNYFNPPLDVAIGDSAQVAFYLCLLYAAKAYLGKSDARLLDKSAAVTAKFKTDANGKIALEDGELMLDAVGGLDAKLEAAYKKGLRTVIVAEEIESEAREALEKAQIRAREEDPDYMASTAVVGYKYIISAAEVASGLKHALCEFLEDIEEDFKYLKLFHSPQKVIMEEQYIPIEVTLERKYRHEVESFLGYAESEEELKRAYALKRMDEESQPSRIPWEEAKKEHQRIMALADPGLGKTTLLRREARLTAQRERQELSEDKKTVDEVVFPIFLTLSELNNVQGEVCDAIPTLIRQHYPKASESVIRLLNEKLKAGKCLLLLDALDEVPREPRNNLSDKLNRFARNYPCPIICTSRIVGYDGAFLSGAKEVEIVPFNQEQTEQYIRTWFVNAADTIVDDSISADGLIRELQNKPQIRGLAQNPLLLSLLCSLYQQRELILPARRSQVYEKSLDCMLSEWRKDRKPQSRGWIIAKTRLLEELAYRFTCEGVEIFSADALYDKIEEYLQGERVPTAFRNSSTPELIDELSELDGILQLERNGKRYLFLHRTFQEYLTASYLNRAIQREQIRGIALAKEHFWDYDWHETLALLAGLMDDPVPLLQATTDEKDDIFSSLLLLAGRCIAECEENPHPLIADIIDRIYELWGKYPTVRFIVSTVSALGQVNSQMLDRLQKALNDEDEYVRRYAADALGGIGSEKTVGALIETLKDEDEYVRRRAASALGEIGDERAVEALIDALKNEDSSVRGDATFALGEIGSEKAVEALIEALLENMKLGKRYFKMAQFCKYESLIKANEIFRKVRFTTV